MSRQTVLGGCALAVAAVAGCYTGPSLDARDATIRTEIANAETASGELPPADLPCDVASVLASACTSCHGAEPTEGAKNRLASHVDLTAPLRGEPSLSEAELCVARMKDATRPMPPATRASENAIAVFEKWIAAGMPKGTCSAVGIDYSVEPVCTSKRKWAGKDRGSEEMHPGDACMSCHEQKSDEHVPDLIVAGTVYRTAHEPIDCNGVNGRTATPVKMVITDADGKVFELPVNRAGNFLSEQPMKKPLRAKLVRGDTFYEMQGDIRDGDCNGCHTAEGDFEDPERARGRIVLP